MNTSCIIEIENFDEISSNLNIQNTQVSKITSNGLTGEVISSALLLTLTATTLANVAKIIIVALQHKKKPKLSYKGKAFSFEVSDVNEETIEKVLKKIIEG